MKQTPIQKAIGILEKVKKNITDKTQINDLDCVINSYKTELLPYEEKYIAEQKRDSFIDCRNSNNQPNL